MHTIKVNTGFGYFKEGNIIVGKATLPIGEHPLQQKFTYHEVDNKQELDAIEVYVAPEPDYYNPDELISWALTNTLTTVPDALKGIAIGSFVDFANKATEASKANFLAIASSVGLTTVANTIINKAVELGADLEEV